MNLPCRISRSRIETSFRVRLTEFSLLSDHVISISSTSSSSILKLIGLISFYVWQTVLSLTVINLPIAKHFPTSWNLCFKWFECYLGRLTFINKICISRSMNLWSILTTWWCTRIWPRSIYWWCFIWRRSIILKKNEFYGKTSTGSHLDDHLPRRRTPLYFGWIPRNFETFILKP